MLTADYIIKTASMFLIITFQNSVFIVCIMISPTKAIYILATLMNSHIETITGPSCRNLSRNIFVITIQANPANDLDLRNKLSFCRDWPLIKDGKTLIQILLLAYMQSKVEMLFAILQIAYLNNIIILLLIKKLIYKNQRIFLYITFGSFMALSDLLYRIVIPSLSTTFGNSQIKDQALIYGCLLYGILK